MANLAASAVTIEESWYEQGPANKRVTGLRVKLVLTGQGGATNKILASVLGLTKIDEAGPFVGDGDDHIYVASRSYEGAFMLLKASATDAPADITDTVRGIVRGT